MKDMTFSPGFSSGYSKDDIANSNYRKIYYRFSHLRTFKIDLFYYINDKDLKD